MWKAFNTIAITVWPKYKEKERKQEFLDKLSGLKEIHITDTTVGVTFLVTDENTGHQDNYFQIGPGEWIAWGSTPIPGDEVTRRFSTRELELHLTDLMRKANPKKPITMIDESNCIRWGK